MREIQVPGITIGVPILGFGCSSLTSVGQKQALRLLESAFDSGIRHFDTARYYGYGEAEGILGGFLKSYRGQVTVTTKFGIDPPRRTSALQTFLSKAMHSVWWTLRGIWRPACANSRPSASISICCMTMCLETVRPMNWWLFCSRLFQLARSATLVWELASIM